MNLDELREASLTTAEYKRLWAGARPPSARSLSLATSRWLLVDYSNQSPWQFVVLWVAGAGGVYPLCVAACSFPFMLHDAIASITRNEPFAIPAGMIFLAIVLSTSCFLGYLYALVASLPAMAALALATWILAWRPNWKTRGALCGGITAYLCTLPLSVSIFNALMSDSYMPLSAACAYIGLGPILACLVGQVFGARYGLIRDPIEAFVARGDERLAARRQPQPRLRFRVRQMLGLTVLLSLLLTLLRVMGLLTLPMLAATLLWIVTMTAGWLPTRAFSRWWLKRRRRVGRAKLFATPATPSSPPLARTDKLEEYWRLHDEQLAAWQAKRRGDDELSRST